MRISLGEVGASAEASEFALIRRVDCVFRILGSVFHILDGV